MQRKEEKEDEEEKHGKGGGKGRTIGPRTESLMRCDISSHSALNRVP